MFFQNYSKQAYVPAEVIRELQHQKTPSVVRTWVEKPPHWLFIRTPEKEFSPLGILDPGEAQALALAGELHADAVLMDEKRGRRIAKEQGFTTLGTLTVLELAAEKGLLELKTALDALGKTTFHLSAKLVRDILEREVAHKRASEESLGDKA